MSNNDKLQNTPQETISVGALYSREDQLERELAEAKAALSEDCEDCDHGIRGGAPCQSCGGCGRVLIADLLKATQRHVKELKAQQSATREISPPTHDEIAAYRDLFRSELDKNMNNSSSSPSTEAHHVALHAFVQARNKCCPPRTVCDRCQGSLLRPAAVVTKSDDHDAVRRGAEILRSLKEPKTRP